MFLYDMDQGSQIDEFGVDHKNFSLRDEIDYNLRRAEEKERQQCLMPEAYNNNYIGRLNAKNRVEARQNMSPIVPDYTQPASLEFDGKNVIWKENDQPLKYWQAQSGHKDFQGSKYTDVPFKGPIPEGDYVLKKGTEQDYGNKEEMSWLQSLNPYRKRRWYEKPYDWGKSRIPIQPELKTNTFGRDKMYVHGGDEFGSSGCVDLAHGNDDFYKDFKNYDADLKLKVKYPKGW